MTKTSFLVTHTSKKAPCCARTQDSGHRQNRYLDAMHNQDMKERPPTVAKPLPGSAPDARWDTQPLNELPIFQMGVHDFVYVLLVNVGVPNPLGINNQHWARRTAIEASSFIHAHLPCPGQSQRFHLLLTPFKGLLSAMLRTTGLAILALIKTKKDMSGVIAGKFGLHGAILELELPLIDTPPNQAGHPEQKVATL